MKARLQPRCRVYKLHRPSWSHTEKIQAREVVGELNPQLRLPFPLVIVVELRQVHPSKLDSVDNRVCLDALEGPAEYNILALLRSSSTISKYSRSTRPRDDSRSCSLAKRGRTPSQSRTGWSHSRSRTRSHPMIRNRATGVQNGLLSRVPQAEGVVHIPLTWPGC